MLFLYYSNVIERTDHFLYTSLLTVEYNIKYTKSHNIYNLVQPVHPIQPVQLIQHPKRPSLFLNNRYAVRIVLLLTQAMVGEALRASIIY